MQFTIALSLFQFRDPLWESETLEMIVELTMKEKYENVEQVQTGDIVLRNCERRRTQLGLQWLLSGSTSAEAVLSVSNFPHHVFSHCMLIRLSLVTMF